MVYVVRSEGQVRKLCDGDNRFVGGFYNPRAGNSIAVVPNLNSGSKVAEGALLTLLHEYAHHFMYTNSSFPVPAWISEGSAEFFSSASFESNGDVLLGRPAQHRGYELAPDLATSEVRSVDAEELFDPDVRAAKTKKYRDYDNFYGMAWLLYHYQFFASERSGQMRKYISELYAGKAQREAALTAFGDFKKLDIDLSSYLRRKSLQVFTIKHAGIVESPIAVRELTDGETAMMPWRIRSKTGISDEKEAEEVVTGARAVAAQFPQDASVLAALAEAEFDAGDHAAAIAAADRALALDPKEVNAYVQKGYALFAMANDEKDPNALDAAYRAATKPFIALNSLENDHPLPLIYFYRSYVDRGEWPTPMAVQGLERAVELAPFDLALRMNLAQQQISEGRFAAARNNLKPLAFYPHPNPSSEAAKAQLTEIEGKPDKLTTAGK